MVKLVDCPSSIEAVPVIIPVAVGKIVIGKVLKLTVVPLIILMRYPLPEVVTVVGIDT